MKKIFVLLTVMALVMLCSCSSTGDTGGNNSASGIENTKKQASSKGELVYDDTAAFDYYEVEGGIAICGFKNYDYVEYDKIIVPSEIDGFTVVGIGWTYKASPAIAAIFGNCEVVLPDTVEFIGKDAFMCAKGLVKLSGAANCKTICSEAFINCENLKEVTFLDNVTDIADDAFLGCTAWEAAH